MATVPDSASAEPEVLRLRIPAALQWAMAIDLALAVLVACLALFFGLSTLFEGWDLGEAVPWLAVHGLYAAAGVWISTRLGRASRWALAVQVPWSGLWIARVTGAFGGPGLDPANAPPLLLLLQAALVLAPLLAIVLPFTPPSLAFFAAARPRD